MSLGRQEPEAEPQGRAPVLGIDLGTSFARVGVWEDGDVSIIPNDRGAMSTPCWVAFTDHGMMVGEPALEQAASNLENTVFAPQRLIGSWIDNPWVQWYSRLWPSQMVQGEDDRPLLRVYSKGQEQLFRPEELVAMILSSLRRCAERKLGRTVVDVCLTVPARYGRMQREAIVEACKLARLNAIQLIKAPTAGAMAYTLTNRSRTENGTFLVCDMGSAYFDFVLLKSDNGHLTERAIGTDYVDLDKNLLQCCLEDLREKWGASTVKTKTQLHRLRRACEAAKKHLSTYSRARVEIKDFAQDLDYSCVLSRSHFEDLVRDDLRDVLEPLSDCLEECGLERWDVCEVVLVGGSSHIPALKRAIGEFFYGLRPVEVMRPEHAAVLGAAAYAAALDGQRAGDVPQGLRKLGLVEVFPWSEAPEPSQAKDEATPRCSGERTGRAVPWGQQQPPVRPVPALPPKPRTRPSFRELFIPPSLKCDSDLPRPCCEPCCDEETETL